MYVADKTPAISQILFHIIKKDDNLIVKIWLKMIWDTICLSDPQMKSSRACSTLPPSMLVELRKQLSSVQLGWDTSRFPSTDVTLLDRHLFMYHGHTIKFSLRSI